MFCDCVALTFVMSAVRDLFFFFVSLVGSFCDCVALTFVLSAVSDLFFFLVSSLGNVL